MRSALRIVLAVLMAALCHQSHALVVAGANGGGDTTNNTTAAQMESQLNLADASFFDNVLQYSDANAVYLGWGNTEDGPRAYLLTAMHITFSNTMLINSVLYSVTRQQIGDSDLALLTLTNVDGIMPSLQTISLASSTPTNGTTVIMVSHGRQRVQNATTNAYTSDAITLTNGSTGYTTTNTIVKRWGTNQITGTNVVNSTKTVYTTFNQPTFGRWLTSSEAQATLGDSGSALFDTNGVLLGIAYTVGKYTNGNTTEAAFGEATYYSDAATYKDQITNAIGVPLIPEPSTAALTCAALAVLAAWRLTRSRRHGRPGRHDC